MNHKDKVAFFTSYISVMENNEISEKIENPTFPCKIRLYICFYGVIYQ